MMNQQRWTYRDVSGKNHLIGLAHSSESGHTMIYCDDELLIIDFQILTDKEYSFFVESELLLIQIIKQMGGNFEYRLTVDDKADTEPNRLRKAENQREKNRLLVGLVVLILLTAGLLLLIKFGPSEALPTKSG